jgi:hypothetical protein
LPTYHLLQDLRCYHFATMRPPGSII